MLVVGERHLTAVLTGHPLLQRPPSAPPLGQQPPSPPPHVVDLNAARAHRRPILRAVIKEYSQAA
jgi:hypothetical protein